VAVHGTVAGKRKHGQRRLRRRKLGERKPEERQPAACGAMARKRTPARKRVPTGERAQARKRLPTGERAPARERAAVRERAPAGGRTVAGERRGAPKSRVRRPRPDSATRSRSDAAECPATRDLGLSSAEYRLPRRFGDRRRACRRICALGWRMVAEWGKGAPRFLAAEAQESGRRCDGSQGDPRSQLAAR
jgi:hypothetical protein